MPDQEAQTKARKVYGEDAYAAAVRRYNELIRKKQGEGLSEEEVAIKTFLQEEFGFTPPQRYVDYY